MKTSDLKNLFHFHFQPRNDRLKSTFQALLIRVNNGRQDGDQWFLKTYLAALNSNGNTGDDSETPTSQEEKLAQVSVRQKCIVKSINFGQNMTKK